MTPLTQRDLFAAHALQGLLVGDPPDPGVDAVVAEQFAADAARLADALVARLARTAPRPTADRRTEALRDVEEALLHYPHWKPEMADHLLAAVRQALVTEDARD